MNAPDLSGPALSSARRGLAIFPCWAGSKIPAFPKSAIGAPSIWQSFATSDLLSLAEKWVENPSYNPAVFTRGYVVIDVDAYKPGVTLETFTSLGPVPDTYTVRTARGGYHFYFKTDEPFGNSRGALPPGIDVRGHGGYVLGAGAVFEGRRYEVINDVDPAPLPEWLGRMLRTVTKAPNDADAMLGAEDCSASIERAKAYVANAAPAIEGEGGDMQTYKICARLRRDFNLSIEAALEVLGPWNDRCSPPWDLDQLEKKLENAGQYGQNLAGTDNPLVGFGRIEHPPGTEPSKTVAQFNLERRFVPLVLPLDALKSIPPRPWMIRGLLLRGAASMLVAPGGTGKSAFTLNVAAAFTLGDGRRFGLDVCEAGRALIINAEDDIHELQRRMGALTMHYGFDPKALEGRLKAYDSFAARSERFKAVVREGGKLRRTPHVAELIRIARGEGFDFLSVDPLVKTHEANENDNGEMDFVVSTYSEIAQEINGSVLLVHHTRKPPNADAEGFAGNADAGRGASSAKDACRIARTLFTMTASEAKRLRVSEDERLSYVRLDDAKGNYSAQKSGGQWFKKHSISLPNGDDAPAIAPVVFDHSEIENARRAKILASLAAAEDSGKGMAATTRGRDNAASYLSKNQEIERDLIISDLKILEGVGDIKKYEDAGTERWAVTNAGRAWASLPEHSVEHSHSEHSASTPDE